MSQPIKWSDLRFGDPLGEGRAGTVYLAHYTDNRDGKDICVAVKRYKRGVVDQPGQLERIVRELEVGRRVSHRNLVKSLALIFDPNGLPALVMRHYEGKTLDAYLNESNYLVPISEAFDILQGICGALVALHTIGVTHRDVKPGNIIMTAKGPVLMDLGVVQSDWFPEQTATDQFLGTIRYSAPDMLFGEKHDKRVDAFSLGAIAYELFFGERYLGDISNWARLVEAKGKYISGHLEIDHSLVEKKASIGVADFVRWMLEGTLTCQDKRFRDLRDILVPLEKRLWAGVFHIDAGRCIEGEPYARRIGDPGGESKKVPLRIAVNGLLKVISVEHRNLLRSTLDDWYWRRSKLRYFDLSDPLVKELIDELQSLDFVRFRTIDSGESSFTLHEVIEQAYRYGYL